MVNSETEVAARRRLRSHAKKHGCYVVFVVDHDCYELISNDTGEVRAKLNTPRRHLTPGDVDEFFERSFQ